MKGKSKSQKSTKMGGGAAATQPAATIRKPGKPFSSVVVPRKMGGSK